MEPNEHTFLAEYSKFLDSSGTHLTYAAISHYRNFNEGLSGKERRFLKNHLESCPSCSKKLQEVADVESDASGGTKANVLRLSTTLFRYSIAAVIIISVGVSVVYYWSRSRNEQSGSSQLSNKSLALETPDPQRFVPNATLESFVGRTVRSASGVRLLAPGIGDTIAIPFTFRWEGGKAGEEYTLAIVDNQNTQKYRGTTRASALIVDQALQRGLYYAKLEVNGDLTRVIKFVIARHP
jgi:hypothetical protein